jgi:hypothetical protein
MKFGKLMALELAADGLTAWPSVRYKLLKIRIEQRKEQESTLFQTGSFKKALREDLLAINAFWAERESELLRARAALHDHDDTDHHKLVRSTFKWLTLNYLAVLKISKKHDKKTHSSLLDAISKVLLTEPFVKALTSSALFADLDAPAATGDPPPVAAAASSMIVQLLGRGSERYFPHSLLSRFDAADLRLAASDVKGTLAAESDGEDEPEVTQREREASTACADSSECSRRIHESCESSEDVDRGRPQISSSRGGDSKRGSSPARRLSSAGHLNPFVAALCVVCLAVLCSVFCEEFVL